MNDPGGPLVNSISQDNSEDDEEDRSIELNATTTLNGEIGAGVVGVCQNAGNPAVEGTAYAWLEFG